MTRSNWRTGFTLVELLVVIAIIAVMVATLLPTLGKARDSAKAVMCQARLRDLYIMSERYSDENSDWTVSNLVWHTNAEDAFNDRSLLTQLLNPTDLAHSYMPVGYRNWGYTNSFKNTMLYCPVEPQIWVPGTPFPTATYYNDSATAGFLYNSGVACYWANGRLGYGNVNSGGIYPIKRNRVKTNLLYLGELNTIASGNFGFWSWSAIKYRHGNGTTYNAARMDGAVKAMREAPTANGIGSEMAWY